MHDLPVQLIQSTALLADAATAPPVSLAVITSAVGIGLSAMTFYLKSLRDHHRTTADEMDRRTRRLARQLEHLAWRFIDHTRDLTTKEDWLRESMLARKHIRRLTQSLARLEAAHDALAGAVQHRPCPAVEPENLKTHKPQPVRNKPSRNPGN